MNESVLKINVHECVSVREGRQVFKPRYRIPKHLWQTVEQFFGPDRLEMLRQFFAIPPTRRSTGFNFQPL